MTEADLRDEIHELNAALRRAQRVNAVLRDALERIAAADYRGYQPAECALAANVLAAIDAP